MTNTEHQPQGAIPPDSKVSKGGRPSLYSDALASEICERIALGESLVTICKEPGMPSIATVFNWLGDESKKEFLDKYSCARDAQADFYAESIISISDDGTNDTYVDDDGNRRVDHDVVARSRLRVDARKWYASKLAPKKYGDRVTQEHTGEGGGPVNHNITVSFVKPK